jgi:cation diffusion facilitator CzcD-associated flavoprotein CzcO
MFHSARWDHEVPLDGQRIGVIGNGSTGVQLVSALAGRAGRLYQFQRTAQWIMPARNRPYTEEEKESFRADPELPRRKLSSGASGALFERFNNAVVDPESEDMREMERLVLENLEKSVQDPVLREKLRPHDRVMCKRLVYSPDYYRAIQHPNAELVSEGIERVEPKGVRTRDGRLIELDVLVLATGFRVDRFMRPMRIIGRSGVDLEDFWAVRPRAYLSISMPDFPNLFMLNGPNGPVGNLSLIEVAERQWHYIWQLIQLVLSGRCREVSVSREAMESFDADRIEAAKKTVWATGCSSWYLDAEGIPASWPWPYQRFKDRMSAPQLDDFELVA